MNLSLSFPDDQGKRPVDPTFLASCYISRQKNDFENFINENVSRRLFLPQLLILIAVCHRSIAILKKYTIKVNLATRLHG